MGLALSVTKVQWPKASPESYCLLLRLRKWGYATRKLREKYKYETGSGKKDSHPHRSAGK